MVFPGTIFFIWLEDNFISAFESNSPQLRNRHQTTTRLLAMEANKGVLLAELKSSLEHEVLYLAKVDDHIGVCRSIVLEVAQEDPKPNDTLLVDLAGRYVAHFDRLHSEVISLKLSDGALGIEASCLITAKRQEPLCLRSDAVSDANLQRVKITVCVASAVLQ